MDIGLLLNILDEAYERQAWHGPNLRGALRGVTASQASWRPAPGRHTIWELAVHAAYWKYAVRRRLIYGVAAHDVYHAGQIQLLKRLSQR